MKVFFDVEIAYAFFNNDWFFYVKVNLQRMRLSLLLENILIVQLGLGLCKCIGAQHQT